MSLRKEKSPESQFTDVTRARRTELEHSFYNSYTTLLTSEAGRRAIYEMAQLGDTHALTYYPDAQPINTPAELFAPMDQKPPMEQEATELSSTPPEDWINEMGSTAVSGAR